MSIQLSGYNSGLPVDDIITKLMEIERRPIELLEQRKETFEFQKGIYSNVQARVNDLLVAVEKLTKRAADGSTIFDAKTGISSHPDIASATATKNAAKQTLQVEVITLPTQTRAASTTLVGKFDNNTTMSQLGITAGNFTIYENGVARTITVAANDTMGQVFTKINTAVTGISADPTIVNGRTTITYDAGNTIQLGAASDTSNFLAKTHLLTGTNNPATRTITASQVNTTIQLDQPVSNAAANFNIAVTNGTFKINGVTFDTTDKSLNQLITEINASAANVTASFNMGTNQFELTAKNTGSQLISLQDSTNGGGTSNFLNAVGLIAAGGNSTSSQIAGKNTEFQLNGTTMFATSTVVDETVHGLTGVTLNLKTQTPGTIVAIDINTDKEAIKSALSDFVTKFNSVMTYIDQQTDAENKGPLAGDSRLLGFRNQLRKLVTSRVSALSGTAYDSLQQAGISTGASAGSATSTLLFDESKFETAFDAAPDTIRKLFVGQDLGGALNNTAADDNMEGSMTLIWQLIDDATYTKASGTTGFGVLYNGPTENEKGLFISYQSNMAKRIEDLNKSIAKGEERLELREKMYRQQFLAMERMIGQFQSQGNALSGLVAQLSANR